MKVTPKQYAMLLMDIESQKLSDEEKAKKVAGVVKLVLKNRDSSKISKIENIYGSLKKKKEGLLDVELVIGEESSEEEISDIKRGLAKKCASQEEKMNFSVVIDKSIRGGFIAKIENEIIDATVDAKLNKLKQSLI